MNAAVIFIRAGLVGAILLGGYYYGEYRAQEEITKYQIFNSEILKKSMDEQKKLQEAANAIAEENYRQAEGNQRTIQTLQTRLRQAHRQKDPLCPLPDINLDLHLELFREALSHPDLSESRDPKWIIGEEGEASYTLYTISEYNDCALQLNSLINLVSNNK